MADTGERTEQPTAKRLKEARDRGQVARSQDLSVAISSLALTLALVNLGPGIAGQMATRLIAGINRIGDHPLQPISTGELTQAILADGRAALLSVGPLLFIAALVGVLGTIGQTGWVFATESLKLNWEKLSPAQGVQRLKPSQGGIEFLKAFLAVSALCAITWKIVDGQLHDGGLVARMAPADAARYGWESIRRLLWQGALAMMALGVGDYLLQRWRTTESLKMTRQEVKDEARASEGSPEIKARVRLIQRQMVRRRMLKAVKTATVVVTNPTHFAVALHYDRASMAAPVVVAKGADHMAQRIKAIARDAGVPMVENVPLAQALYKGAEVGDVIPGALFGAVAEVLAYLVRIRQLVL
ncbi:MAG: EscU/YscU/HrcU family type III secretion system export apparatus switch protein [Acidobacteria bacterium]|nr:EscU/YscU/HrcU family type III secretion system export apparatus switch protein [Acidobacteriota bacterium]